MTTRKTTQALKISASWTPTEEVGIRLARSTFGAATPLRFDGGRIVVKAAIKLDLSDPAMATQVAARAAELRKELAHAETVSKEPFHMADKLAEAQKQLADLEADIAANPVAPPHWLRSGAPVDTPVFWDGKQFIVSGHRWTNDGYFVQAEDGRGSVAIPYMEAQDAQGMPLYEEHEFTSPTVIEKKDEEKPAFSRLESVFSALEGDGRNRIMRVLDYTDEAEIIRYIDKNFVDILGELDDAGRVKIEC